MARPRRLRAQIDVALISAEQFCAGYLAQFCHDFSPASRQCTEKLVELIEALAGAMVLHKAEISSELDLLVKLSHQFVERQLDRLRGQNIEFVSGRGLQAFFLLQLFERLRQEVVTTKKEQFERSAGAAYFTPIDLSYYLVKSAFHAQENWHDQSRLLDFCSGSGSLSIAALDYLAYGQDSERFNILCRHLSAVEIDPLIFRSYIACLSVACSTTIKETMAAAAINRNFVIADGLPGRHPDNLFNRGSSFDLVLSNPPWQTSSYLVFVEAAGQFLATGGVAAVLTPQGILSDQGASNLRRMLFQDFRWQSCEGFVNEDLAFDIHPSYKYALSVFAKKQSRFRSAVTSVRFGSIAGRSLAQEKLPWLSYSFDLVSSLSPASLAIFECDWQEQLQLFKAVSESNAPLYLLHEDGQMQMDRGRYKQWHKSSLDPAISPVSRTFSLRFARDFDMSLDKELFLAPERAQEAGFRIDCYGRHLLGKWQDLESKDSSLTDVMAASELILSQDRASYIERERVEECLLPLIEGRMLDHFDVANKLYVSGSGRQALWHDSHYYDGQIAPQYLLRQADFCKRRHATEDTRIGFISVSAPTNTRSMVAALLPHYPAGNSVPFLSVAAATISERAYWGLIMVSVLNSFSFDFVLRTRFGGNNLNYFLLDQCSVPQLLVEQMNSDRCKIELSLIAQIAALLSLSHLSLSSTVFAYLAGRTEQCGFFASELASLPDRLMLDASLRMPLPQRRRLRALLDALVARLYGLSVEQFAEILSGCLPGAASQRLEYSRGFHRVDKQLPVEQRLPNLAYQIFQDIEMNRLDLNSLAGYGFTLPRVSSGHGRRLLEQNEERFREYMAWLKLHQNRLDPFHQKSGVK